MSTLNDLWFSYLGDLGYTGSLPDRLHKALQAESGETALKSLNDMWNTYLVGEGYTSGTLDDKMYAWLGDKGYVGSITDRWYGALAAGNVFAATPGGDVLLCPYVMDSQAVPSIGADAFDSFTFASGVGTGVALGDSTSKACGSFAEVDYPGLLSPVPGESTFVSLPPGNGKIAFEMELTEKSDQLNNFGMTVSVGDFGNGALAQGQIVRYDGFVEFIAQGSGSVYIPAENPIIVSADTPTSAVGDRIGAVIDTDTGTVDLVTDGYHENFSGQVIVDITFSAGFNMSVVHSSSATTDTTVKGYTKASDMELPYPPGTKDTCGNAVSRELVTYPLDASEAEVQGIGLTGKLDNPSLAQQRGEYTVLDGTPAWPGQYAMIRSQSDPGFINNWSTGKVAMEWDITVPTFTPEVAGGTGTIVNNLGVVLNAGTFQGIVFIGVVLDENGDRSLSTVIGSNQTITEISQDINRLGLLIDNDTNTLRVWLNGVEQVFNDPSFAANTFDAVTPLALVIRVTTDDNGAAGLKMVNRYITEPYFFTTPFPAGSRDINGNVFN